MTNNYKRAMDGFKRMLDEIDYDAEEYLIDIQDGDGDRMTISSPWSESTLMMRIENDDTITGFLVTPSEAMIIVGCLMKLIEQWDFQGHIKDLKREAHYLNRYYKTKTMNKPDPEDEAQWDEEDKK